MKNKHLKMIGNLLLFMIALLVGATNGVAMAEAVPLPGGGAMAASGTDGDGALSISAGSAASPDLYLSDIDKRITKMRPMSSPIDQISRYAKKVSVKSQEIKFYSLGTKPIATTLSSAVTAMTTGKTCTITPTDSAIFDIDDTIRVVGVKGFKDGVTQDADEDLLLLVCGVSQDTSMPTVCALNGKKDSNGNPLLVPAIPVNTKLVRLGKACCEIDAQTASFSNVPTQSTQYCQNFMMQIEETTFHEKTSKEVNWSFTDLEEDSIFDMRLGQENSFLFGAKSKMPHPLKNKHFVYSTGGLWWQAGKDIVIGKIKETGTADAPSSEVVIEENEFVDVAKQLFAGTNSGSTRKLLFAGSELMAALAKTKSDKVRIKSETVECWGLKFKSFDTDFGEVLGMYHPLFDLSGMMDKGLCIDPNLLTKSEFLSFDRSLLDLKELGLRNSKAVVLQEVCALYLRYADCHARIHLNAANVSA